MPGCFTKAGAAAAAIAASLAFTSPAGADNAAPSSAEPTLSAGFKFTEHTGEALYANVCQGCHMADGKGATGAARYPALAADPNLAIAGYAVDVVVNGKRAMPPVGLMMNDDQVAAVVNYVRTHFGNDYRDAVTADQVKALRR
jgi:mono/diheme cytochrome c family protein